MVARIQVALLSIVAAFGLFLAFTATAKADDKKGKDCEVCAAVKDVCAAMDKCAKCAKPDPKCEHCQAAAKEHAEKFKCKDCADKKETCATCKKLLDEAKGDKIAAAKKLMESQTFCCKNCEKAGEAKAEKCAKCKEAREKIEKAEVKQ